VWLRCFDFSGVVLSEVGHAVVVDRLRIEFAFVCYQFRTGDMVMGVGLTTDM